MRFRQRAVLTAIATAALTVAGASSAGASANATGPYDPYGVAGAASANGKGNGNAYGRPCAGCVGNADTKNPPGQLPSGADPNSGYECDANSGIGLTNPAHSGCDPTGGDDGGNT